ARDLHHFPTRRSSDLVGTALERLRAGRIEVEPVGTSAPGHATELVRAADARGCRKFIAVGGDGTSYEIVNGLFPEAHSAECPTRSEEHTSELQSRSDL